MWISFIIMSWLQISFTLPFLNSFRNCFSVPNASPCPSHWTAPYLTCSPQFLVPWQCWAFGLKLNSHLLHFHSLSYPSEVFQLCMGSTQFLKFVSYNFIIGFFFWDNWKDTERSNCLDSVTKLSVHISWDFQFGRTCTNISYGTSSFTCVSILCTLCSQAIQQRPASFGISSGLASINRYRTLLRKRNLIWPFQNLSKFPSSSH